MLFAEVTGYPVVFAVHMGASSWLSGLNLGGLSFFGLGSGCTGNGHALRCTVIVLPSG